MLRTQKGFTLIELVMVIVILGILAAVVIPQYINLSGQANQAAVQGVAGSMSSAMAINFAARSISATAGAPVNNCNSVANILQGGIPSGYSVPALAITSGTSNTNCLVGNGTYSANFVGIGI